MHYDLLTSVLLLGAIFVVYSWILRNALGAKPQTRKMTYSVLFTSLPLFFAIYKLAFVESDTGMERYVWPALITAGMGGLMIATKPNDPSKRLRSEPDDSSPYSRYITWKNKPKDVAMIENDSISTYPRFTFHLIRSGEWRGDVLFDSSDFQIVNGLLGTDKGRQPSLRVGYQIKLDQKEYIVQRVTVDMLCLFDDYSRFGHTKQYEGSDTPYNVQIILDLSEVSTDGPLHVSA